MEESRTDHIERVKHYTRKRPRHERFLPTQTLTVTTGNIPGVTLWDVRAQWWDLRLWWVARVGWYKMSWFISSFSLLPSCPFFLPLLSYPVLSFPFFQESCLLLHYDHCPCRVGQLVTWLESRRLVDIPLEWPCEVLGWGSQKANALIKFHGSM